jgi:hypothetical protein
MGRDVNCICKWEFSWELSSLQAQTGKFFPTKIKGKIFSKEVWERGWKSISYAVDSSKKINHQQHVENFLTSS